MLPMNPGRRVLICEDVGLTVLALRKALVRAGYVVVGEEAEGEKAAALAEELQPDLILMDIGLRGAMSGLEAMHQILARQSVPIIVISAYSDDATVQSALFAGAFGYLVKPVTGMQLLNVIETALERFAVLQNAMHALAAVRSSYQSSDARLNGAQHVPGP